MASAQTLGKVTRHRAPKACQRCNSRRVKCDAAVHGTPCSRCQSSGHAQCVLIESRRGRYPRKKTTASQPARDTQRTGFTKKTQSEAIVTNPEDAHTPSETAGSEGVESPVSPLCNRPNHAPPTRRVIASDASPAVTSSDAADDHMSKASNSYREISWAGMFDHFLEQRRSSQHSPMPIDKCSITYLGESFPLALVLEDLKDGDKPHLHHAGPPLEKTSKSSHPEHMLPEDLEFLNAKRAFEYPPAEALDALLSTFIDRFFPLYPIVNRIEFLAQTRDRTIPWILLHASCFVAATFCPPAVLHRAGYSGRRQARNAYYAKAKALFDTGYESNKIVILQSVIMLTFWGGGPNNYWNFYSWISCGVTIAETLGMHRSLARANMSAQDRSLLKRLWWVLVVRDASCGALVGRPFRISMDHCDTEMLSDEDFLYDTSDVAFAQHPLRRTFSLYQIAEARLALILRDIVTARFNRDKRNISMATLKEELNMWRSDLPAELNWTDDGSSSNPLSASLSILFDHHQILTHLGRSAEEAVAIIDGGGDDSPQHIMEMAAQRISATASAVAMRSQTLLVPHELFQGVFLAGVVAYTQMKSVQPMIRQIGRTALNNCQLVLNHVHDAYDPSPWVMNLFDRLLNHLKEDASAPIDASTLLDLGNMSAGVGSADGWSDGNMYGAYDSWQVQPNHMLSALFDMSPDNTFFPQIEQGFSQLSGA